MTEIDKMLNNRDLPNLLLTKRGKRVRTVKDYEARKEEIKTILQEKQYGYIPQKPEHLKVEIKTTDDSFCCGMAPLNHLEVECTLNGRSFSFPARSVIPRDQKNIPAFVLINFDSAIPHKYYPAEEIAERGFAVFSFSVQDICKDMSGDFKDKCGKYLLENRKSSSAPGKIALWAWAAMRLMDYIETLDFIDKESVAVIGHSRLGKTALVAGGFDERFKYVISNNSGCCGAALTRGGIGETIGIITEAFPFWFCPGFTRNADRYFELGIDQNLLLGLSVPRQVMIGSADEDLWADPNSEFLSVASLKDAYAIYGKRGLVCEDRLPISGEILSQGDAHYHIREGGHYLSRTDWNIYMDYIEAHRR